MAQKVQDADVTTNISLGGIILSYDLISEDTYATFLDEE